MAEMTFWDHLDELRRVLFRVIGVWFVLAVGYFIAMPYLFDSVVLAPCHNDFVFYDLLRYIGEKFDLTDDFFTNADLHDPAGANIMLLGLDVLPEHQQQGLARELMEQYKEREQVKGRKKLILTCLPDKVEMYKKFGFKDHGIGDSVWGGEAWHEMDIVLE